MKELNINNSEQLTKMFLDLSKKAHPIVIGNVFRSWSQIVMLAEKLLSQHFEDEAKIRNIISFLCSESGGHDYPIYKREARNNLLWYTCRT